MFRRYGRLSDAPKVRIGPKPGSMRSLRGERQEYILDLPSFGSPEAPLKAPDGVPEAPLKAPDGVPEAPLKAPDGVQGRPPRYWMSRGGDPRGSSPATPPAQTLPTRQVSWEPGEMREDVLKKTRTKAGTRAGPNQPAQAMLNLSTRPRQGRPNKRKETGTNG